MLSVSAAEAGRNTWLPGACNTPSMPRCAHDGRAGCLQTSRHTTHVASPQQDKLRSGLLRRGRSASCGNLQVAAAPCVAHAGCHVRCCRWPRRWRSWQAAAASCGRPPAAPSSPHAAAAAGPALAGTAIARVAPDVRGYGGAALAAVHIAARPLSTRPAALCCRRHSWGGGPPAGGPRCGRRACQQRGGGRQQHVHPFLLRQPPHKADERGVGVDIQAQPLLQPGLHARLAPSDGGGCGPGRVGRGGAGRWCAGAGEGA